MQKRILLISIIFLSIQLQANIIYVNINVEGGNNNGTSWENAYNSLQLALILSNYGDSIWVAKGTYYPTNSTNRLVSFTLINGRKMFGGFEGIETELSDRNWEIHQTILSGDIGVPNDSTDNSYNVMRCTYADSTTIMDGFVITDGNADNGDASANSFQRNGGGFFFKNDDDENAARPLFKNCLFQNNSAERNGGGAYVASSNNEKSILILENCTFLNNISVNGGGLFIENVDNNFDHRISHCSFIKNISDSGGGINFTFSTGEKDLIIKNSNFIQNSTKSIGSGVHINTFSIVSKKIIIDSCLFKENFGISGHDGVAISFLSFLPNENVDISILNSNIRDNSSSSSVIAFGNIGQLKLTNCELVNNFTLEFMSISDIKSGLISNTKFSNWVFSSLHDRGFFFGISDSADTIEFLGCTFYDSFHTNGLDNAYFHANWTPQTEGPKIFTNNCIFSPNQNNLGYQNLIDVNGQGILFDSNNSLYSFSDSTIIGQSDHINLGPNNLFNQSPQFTNPENGDFTLLPCSPARNTGSNAALDSLNLSSDLAGNQRIQGGTVDMGAYESPVFTIEMDTLIPANCGSIGATLQLNLSRGCPPFSISYANKIQTADSTFVLLDSLPAGNYPLIINDFHGEADTLQLDIEVPPILEATLESSPLICPEGTGSSAVIAASGGTGDLQYLWSNADTLPEIINIETGTYAVTVTDENGCTLVDSVLVESEGLLPLSINVFPVSCHNSSDGIATVTPLNGTMPFEWNWADGQTSETIENLSGGNYAVTVTDALGCTDILEFQMNPPDSLEIEISATDASCFEGLDGFATVEVSGGNAPYFYEWSDGQMDSLATNLTAGEYFVTVTDAKDCVDSLAVLVEAPPILAAEIFGDEFLCFDELGSLTTTVSGGTIPYNFDWQTGETDSLLTNLSGGIYEITISDAQNCDTILNFEIIQTTAIQIDTSISPNISLTNPNGKIEINEITGGNPDYEFLWSNGATTPNLDSLTAGEYFVTITDADSCQQVFVFEVDFLDAVNDFEKLNILAQIIPNPTEVSDNAVLKLMLEQKKSLSLEIYNSIGQKVFSDNNSFQKGRHFWELPNNLLSGNYFLKLENKQGNILMLKWVVI